MAAATSTPLSLSPSSAVIDSKGSRQSAAASSQCVTFPTLPPRPIQSQSRAARSSTTYSRKAARNVFVMATGEAQTTTEVVEAPAVVEAPKAVAEEPTTETPEIVKTILEKWDKVEDKYAVIALLTAGVVVLWGSAGLLYAIDRLPLIPGVLELVGIGYTIWFAYKNLVFKPEREALIGKIGNTYKEITGI